MDLYADLPLAKGATTALDADGEPKNPVSVWAKGVPVVPPSAGRGKVFVPPSVQAGGGNSTTRAKSPSGGVSFAFKPASIARKANTSVKSTPANAFSAPVTAREPSPKTETQTATFTQRTGLGFVAATTWTQVTVQKENHPSTENAAASAGDSGSHFFQVTYRDEYHPSRPNSYEAFCDDRRAKEKMEQVKRDLERRQREQDKESKREREQLLKDVVEGKASSVPLQASAGRGRGMTVPAWMRKKMEENAARAGTADSTTAPSTSVLSGTERDQFDDAAPRMGLGFSKAAQSSGIQGRPKEQDEFGREILSSHRAIHPLDHRERSHRSPSRCRDRSHHQEQSRSRSRDRRGSSRPDRYARDEDSRPSVNGGQPPSRVLLLLNMVGPGEVDDDLQDEVKEECTTKYGSVRKCVVHELRGRVSPDEAVRIFVEFENQAHADKALAGLNYRFFGGRQVKARYYDQAKFSRLDLTS